MDVYWMEQTEAQVPSENRWLSEGERLCLGGMRFPKRRADWRLGRWTAKRAVAAFLDLPDDQPTFSSIEIRAASSGAPEVFSTSQLPGVTISLSHRAGSALCSVAEPGTNFGCDLELVEPHSNAFVVDYFTLNERTLVEQAPDALRPLLMALIWSAKESTLKALRVGLRHDTRSLDVRPEGLPLEDDGWSDGSRLPNGSLGPNGWSPLRIRYSGTQVFRGWWRQADSLVRTVVSALPLTSPLHLDCPKREADPLRRVS